MQITNSYIGKCLVTLLVGVWFTLGFASRGQADEAQKVAADVNGNAYVTGSSFNGVNNDYVTIKYNTNGAWVWGRRYESPVNGDDEAVAVALDSYGNVYVTGRSRNAFNWDYVTIKYDATGNWVWGRRYNGPANGDDEPTALTVDAADNVYVTGRSWNGANRDYVTIKYDTNGNWLWGRRYNGPDNGNDEATALALGPGGNVHVTGFSYNASYNTDYVIIKYSPSGDWLWDRRYNGPANDYDYATDLAVDASGNVYVTGHSEIGSLINPDYVTIKYDSTGVWLWGRRYNGPANANDRAYALALDAVGNVYVTGSSWGGANNDYVTIKYDATGNWVWGQRYNGPDNGDDNATALSVDVYGVYITGNSYNGVNYDYVTIKYSSSGAWVWGQRYDGPADDGSDDAWALAVADGNVYVTGQSWNGDNNDYVTIKYSPAGAWLWGARYDGPD